MKYFFITCGLILWTNLLVAQNMTEYTNSNKKEKMVLEEKVQSLEMQIEQIENDDIDKFLNIQDTTIFGSKFRNLSASSIPKRSREFYLLIQYIHNLNELITCIENMNISQLLSAGNQLTEARRLIDEINSFVTIEKRRITDYLSEVQKQYFRDLVNRYNELNTSLNR